MASIRAKKQNGKIVSYQLISYLGKDKSGSQIRRYSTWYVPEGMTPAKARKAAQRAADELEMQYRKEFQLCSKTSEDITYSLILPDERQDDFSWFVREVWFNLHVCNGEHKERTVKYYEEMMSVLLKYFEGKCIQQITSVDVSVVIKKIRTDYYKKNEREISSHYLWHHYSVLRNIFNYAENNGFITKNPMRGVSAPKIERKSVDAFSVEEVQLFFEKLSGCSTDFRCMMYLLILTGLRRGECLGLQWKDIDFCNNSISVRKNAVYITKKGVIISTPKTFNSIRTIPVPQLVMDLFLKWKSEYQNSLSDNILEDAFVFPSKDSVFKPRNPDAVTRRLKRFLKNNGLPDMSPHDLRHTASTLMLASGADIKSVQNILGHSDARTTLTYYARADINQMRNATERYAAVFELN